MAGVAEGVADEHPEVRFIVNEKNIEHVRVAIP